MRQRIIVYDRKGKRGGTEVVVYTTVYSPSQERQAILKCAQKGYLNVRARNS